ncbi:MAG TPA: GAF and ANTAR domain-containing protein [Nakamurella sp.]|jgi:transcriptional regulator with GAF, ATPase, and Fis domain|nr:GAF and ANTAR domain-containing protein [Nakamurella sp.]
MTTSIDPAALAANLRHLTSAPPARSSEGSLRGVIEACLQLFSVQGSGLMITDERSTLRYVVSSDGPGRLLETAQIDTGEGPCVDTFVRDEVTVCTDVANDPRWPKLGPIMRGSGVAAVLGVPVHLSGICVASLNLYRSTRQRWDPAECTDLTRYGQVVGATLGAIVSAEQAGALAAQLNYALDYRVPIERGVGYLMARDRIDHIEAFTRLRSAARNSRRKIGDVAMDLLSTGRLPNEG